MSKICYIGIDNGATGSVGVIFSDGTYDFYITPTIKQLSYTKTKQYITRIDFDSFYNLLNSFSESIVKIAIERPMINPVRFAASISAARALESTLIIIEKLSYSFEYVDSKNWQKVILPSGLVKEELKKASLDIGKRLFPKVQDKFKSDADGILIAQYLKLKDSPV